MIVHLFALLVPALAAQIAGLTVGTIGLAAILGRSVLSRLLIWERLRLLSTLRFNSSVRAVFILAGGETILLLLRGVVLLGFGIASATHCAGRVQERRQRSRRAGHHRDRTDDISNRSDDVWIDELPLTCLRSAPIVFTAAAILM